MQEEMMMQPNNEDIMALKLHLKSKYSQYSDEEIDEIIHKFISEYLQKLKN